jgi:quercetin dioxygenase-like cupin family protein
MTKKKCLGIWMDHSTAHLMEFTSNIKTHVFSNTFDHQEKVVTLKLSERKMHNKEQQEQHAFYEELINQLKLYGEILLFGPTDAKLELLNLIKSDLAFSTIKITVKNSDKMTEAQEHAFVKEYFTQKNKTEYKNYIMDNKKEIEKAKAHIVVALIEYIPNAVVSKTIIKKTTGNITATSFDIGEELGEKTLPFDTYVQIIDGTAEVVINDKQLQLSLGEGIIIPAHAKHSFNANEQFKMLTTVIKSGYEDLN